MSTRMDDDKGENDGPVLTLLEHMARSVALAALAVSRHGKGG